MSHHFYAMLSRMKYITRWGLMRNTRPENLSEHALEVAVLAHALAILGNTRLGLDLDPDRAASLALFHDASEILTGDLPTPVKYAAPDIKLAYKQVERDAACRLLEMLPADLQASYRALLLPEEADPALRSIVKAAEDVYKRQVLHCDDSKNKGEVFYYDLQKAIRSTV